MTGGGTFGLKATSGLVPWATDLSGPHPTRRPTRHTLDRGVRSSDGWAARRGHV